MSAVIADTTKDAKSYLTDGTTIRSWLLTTDHKRIALLYLGSITLFFFIGGIAAALIRYNLIAPQGMISSAETYNRLFTTHGVVMVWFFLIPAVPATLGNFLVPLMLGARDLAFPKLNLISWYLFIFAGAAALYSLVAGGADTGWTFYTPLTTAYSKGHVVATVVAIFIAGFSSIATGLNFIISIHTLRAPGMTWYKMPVFLWSLIRDKRDLGARDPGAGDDVAAAGLRADLSRWRIRPGDRRRPAIVPTFILVLLTPGGVCDDFAGVRRGQRDRSGILE